MLPRNVRTQLAARGALPHPANGVKERRRQITGLAPAVGPATSSPHARRPSTQRAATRWSKVAPPAPTSRYRGKGGSSRSRLARRLRESSPRQGRRVRSTRSRLSIFSEGYVIRFVQIHGRWIEVGYYLQAALQYRATKVRPIGHPSGPARSASPSSLAIIWLSSDAAGREPSVARPARS
jgi:hypothetical protein